MKKKFFFKQGPCTSYPLPQECQETNSHKTSAADNSCSCHLPGVHWNGSADLGWAHLHVLGHVPVLGLTEGTWPSFTCLSPTSQLDWACPSPGDGRERTSRNVKTFPRPDPAWAYLHLILLTIRSQVQTHGMERETLPLWGEELQNYRTQGLGPSMQTVCHGPMSFASYLYLGQCSLQVGSA